MLFFYINVTLQPAYIPPEWRSVGGSTNVIVAFLITTSIYRYIGQTISSIFRLPDARGSIIVGTQDLVVAPSAKLKPFAAWLSVVSMRVPLNSSS